MPKPTSKVRYLKEQGFDLSVYLGNKTWRVRCSKCETLIINGVPTHELACPNRIRFPNNSLRT